MGNTQCPTCGVGIAEKPSAGLCPKCVADLLAWGDTDGDDQPALDCGTAPSGNTNAASERSPVRIFGDYELLERVGRGGMGVVYKARQISLNRIVALKMIRGGEFAGEPEIGRFQAEAESVARLDHPNIIPIYEVGQQDGEHYFSMKFVQCAAVGKHLERYRLDLPAAAGLLETVARAVHHAHQHGVLHRDLKPGNILVNECGIPFVTDFGIAKAVFRDGSGIDPAATCTGAILGTPAYMSPEQAADGKHVTVATDVYGLGAVLYELITGVAPFKGNSPTDILRQLQEQEPQRPCSVNPKIPADLETICLKCLEKAPDRRYPSAEAVAGDLRRWARNEPIEARPAGTLRRARRWLRRNRVPAALIAVLVLSLAQSLVFLRMVMSDRAEVTRDLEESRENARKMELKSRVIELWNGAAPSMEISSAELATLMGRKRTLNPVADPIRIAIHNNNPTADNVLSQHALLVFYLEDKLNSNLPRPVRASFVLFKSNDAARAALLDGKIDYLRMGANSYLLAMETHAAITLVARERNRGGRQGIIFARRGSRIAAVADLQQTTIAFGNSTATTSSVWAPSFLLSHGLRISDFKGHQFHAKQGDAFRKVLNGEFDVGVAGRDVFEQSDERENLKRIAIFKSDEAVWVGRKDLHPQWHEQIQRAITSLSDSSVLDRLPGEVQGFDPVADRDFDELRQARKASEAFFAAGTARAPEPVRADEKVKP